MSFCISFPLGGKSMGEQYHSSFPEFFSKFQKFKNELHLLEIPKDYFLTHEITNYR